MEQIHASFTLWLTQSSRNISLKKFIRMVNLLECFTYAIITDNPKRKKELKKRHPGLKPKCQTRLHLWRWHTNLMIRQELLSASDAFISWPPGENQLRQGNFQNPQFTNLLLTSVLSGKGNCTKRISHLVHSIAQDLTQLQYGKKKNKKNILSLVCA